MIIKSSFYAFSILVMFSSAVYAKTIDVKMLNNAPQGGRGFDPAVVYIHSGDSVHFVATDKGHNAQSIPDMIPQGATPFSGKISQDLTVTFSKPGIYGYKCLPHYWLGMVGLVVVDNTHNLDDVRKVSQPGAAKTRFDKLFNGLDTNKK